MAPKIGLHQFGIFNRLGNFGLIIVTSLLISFAPDLIQADDAVSNCLRIAALKLYQGQNIVVTATGGMTTRGGLVAIDTSIGTLTIQDLRDARDKTAQMTFMESQIAKIETERSWPLAFFIGGAFCGGIAGTVVADRIDDDESKRIGVYGIGVITGATLGYLLSTTLDNKTVIDCSNATR